MNNKHDGPIRGARRLKRDTGRQSVTLFLALLLSLATACQRKTAPDRTSTGEANQSGQTNQDAKGPPDKGDLKLVYQPRKTSESGGIVGSNPQVLTQIVANLNDKIALPWDVNIVFKDCDEPDANYDPDTRS